MLFVFDIFPLWVYILMLPFIIITYVSIHHNKRKAEKARTLESLGFNEMICSLRALGREYDNDSDKKDLAKYRKRIQGIKSRYLVSGGNANTFETHLMGQCFDLWCRLYSDDRAS